MLSPIVYLGLSSYYSPIVSCGVGLYSGAILAQYIDVSGFGSSVQTIFFDSNGLLYFEDFRNERVVVMNITTAQVVNVIAPGFIFTLGMYMDQRNILYVSDYLANRVWAINTTNNVIVQSFYEIDTASRGIAVDLQGNIYMCATGTTNTGPGALYKYSQNGTLIYTLTHSSITWCMDVIIDSSSNVWVVSYYTALLAGFTSNTSFIGSYNTGLSGPQSLIFDNNNNIIIGDAASAHINIFSLTTRTMGTAVSTSITASTYTGRLAWNPTNNGLYVMNGVNQVNQLNPTTGATIGATLTLSTLLITGLAVDKTTNTAYISDQNHGIVYRIMNGQPAPITTSSLSIVPFYSTTWVSGSPGYLTADMKGNLYICDPASSTTNTNGRILIVNRAGQLINTLNSSTTTGLASPQAVVIDDTNSIIYVLDRSNVIKILSSGSANTLSTATIAGTIYNIALNPITRTLMANIKSSSTSISMIYSIASAGTLAISATPAITSTVSATQLLLDASGNYYMADATNNRVLVYNSAGLQTYILQSPNATFGYGTGFLAIDNQQYLWMSDSNGQFVQTTGINYGQRKTNEDTIQQTITQRMHI